MKTLAITLVTLITLSTVSTFSNEVNQTTEKTVSITLEKAITNPQLVWTMYNQLDDDFLNKEFDTYTASVLYNGIQYFITGTHEEWILFFLMDL